MLIVASILFAWSAAIWFTQPLLTEGLPTLPLIFQSPLIPLLAGLVLTVISVSRSVYKRLGRQTGATQLSATGTREIIAIACLFIIAVGINIPAIVMVRGSNDTDSGLYGLAGFQIADGEMRPAFNVRKHHMGSLVPHITAGLNLLLGQSPYYLRIVNVLIYSLFAIVLFILIKRWFGFRTGLFAGILAAISIKEIYKFLHVPETALTLLFGVGIIYCLDIITSKESVNPARFYWLGLLTGISFWVHFQSIVYIVLIGCTLLVSEKLFFRKWQWTLLVPGFLVGAIPVIVHNIAYGWPLASVFFGEQGVGAQHSAFNRIYDGTLKVLGHIPTMLGTRADYRPNIYHENDFFSLPVTVLIILVFSAFLGIFIWKHKSLIINWFTKRKCKPGPTILLILSILMYVLFCLSSYATNIDTSMRYVQPMWLLIIVVLAYGSNFLISRARLAGYSLFAILSLLWLGSAGLEISLISIREDVHKEFTDRLEESGVNRFYGGWLRTSWTTFVTNEEIIGDSSFPQEWQPFPVYHYAVADSSKPNAYLVPPHRENIRELLQLHFRNLNLQYTEEETEMGWLFIDFPAAIHPAQLQPLPDADFRVHIDSLAIISSVEFPEAFSNQTPKLLGITITNSGSAQWPGDDQNQVVSIVLRSSNYTSLKEQAVVHNLAVSDQMLFHLPLSDELIEQAKFISVDINGIPFHTERVDLHTKQVKTIEYANFKTLVIDPTKQNFADGQFWFGSGWGALERRDSGTIRWSKGNSSIIHFYLEQTKNPIAIVRMFPFKGELMPEKPQSFSVYLNETPIHSNFNLVESDKFEIALPRELINSGLNELTFHYDVVQETWQPLPGMQDNNMRVNPRAIGLQFIRIRP